jgi:hypothetical protein
MSFRFAIFAISFDMPPFLRHFIFAFIAAAAIFALVAHFPPLMAAAAARLITPPPPAAALAYAADAASCSR